MGMLTLTGDATGEGVLLQLLELSILMAVLVLLWEPRSFRVIESNGKQNKTK